MHVPKIVGERGKGTEGLARALQYVDKIEQQTTGSRQKIADKREPAQESARKQTAAMSGQQTGSSASIKVEDAGIAFLQISSSST